MLNSKIAVEYNIATLPFAYHACLRFLLPKPGKYSLPLYPSRSRAQGIALLHGEQN